MMPCKAKLTICGPSRGSLAHARWHAWHGGLTRVATRSRCQLACHSTRQAEPKSAYIHLPFCKRKCFYCDFPVQAVGQNTTSNNAFGMSLSADVIQKMQSYVDTLCQEIDATQELGTGPLDTVFFGGGTPSLVPPELVQVILSKLRSRFGISPTAEVSMEADPGTFDLQRLRRYRDLGVNRVSIGVQAFQEDLLQACGRTHTLSDVYNAIEAVQASGMPTWSLDLISGLPQLTMAKWQASLSEAIKAGPNHVSVYDLQVEEGTPFARWYQAGQSPLPQDEDAAVMYATASKMLSQAGYEHYEVSNYAKPGHRCAHNQTYWLGKPYYAFGLGAASYLQGRRFSRPAKMTEYVKWVEAFAHSGVGLPGSEMPQESQEERLLDTIMLRLRMADGLDLDLLAQEFGTEAAQQVAAALQLHVQRGTVVTAATRCPDLPGVTRSREAEGTAADRDNHQGALSGPPAGAVVKEGSDDDQALGGAECSKSSSSSNSSSSQQYKEGVYGHVRLKDPEGFLLSNDIISDVFAGFLPAQVQ